MTDFSLEIAALVRGVEVLWKRAGRTMPAGLFPAPRLSEADTRRLQLANRLAGGIAPDSQRSAARSIFGRIKVKQGGSGGFLPVQALSAKTPAYPLKGAPDAAALTAGYTQLCAALEHEAAALQPLAEAHPEAYLEGLYFLLERYTSNVPVSSSLDDVSLFDYNHTAAALCSVLRATPEERIGAMHGTKGTLTDNAPLAALVSGDIAGVQDFIYSLSKADQAAKQLRGRSFYLQALTEAVLRFILRGLQLPISSVIYSGGAHFYILAPESVRSQLDDLRRTITQGMLAFHGRDLYLVVGSATVTANDLMPGQIKGCWSALHADLAARKRQRYAELDDSEQFYRDVFRPAARPEHDPLARFFEQIGRSIPYASHVRYGIGSLEGDPNNALEALSVSLSLDAPDWQERSMVTPDYAVRYAIRDSAPTQAGRTARADAAPLVDGTRYMVNLIPMSKQGDPVSFDELAETPAFLDEKAAPHGIKRLGILRMDVDNLGTIFRDGFHDQATLARIITLSRTLATFFEGRVAEICREVEQKYGTPVIYSVYAGGDDIFMVGPWHLMPTLASQIRAEFGKLTGEHPDLTLSGGIALVAEKFPLYQAAEIAHEALEKAKARRDKDGNPVKNALCFLEEVLAWDATATDVLTFRQVEEWAQKFIKAGKEQGRAFPMGILGRLMEFESQRRESERLGQSAQWGRWIWQGIYQFYRLREQYDRHNPQMLQLIKDILETLQQKHFATLPMLAVAARWAHLTLRRMSADA